ncbi:type II CAAX prenyl endopeptidase Rce1 family protein [Noviherbaspirillum sp. ST9]
MFRLLILDAIVGLSTAFLLDYLIHCHVLPDPGKHIAEDLNGIFYGFFFPVLLAPVFEETIFRLPLRKVRGSIYLIFISVIVAIFSFVMWQIAIPVSVVFFIAMKYTLKQRTTLVFRKWKENYGILFYYVTLIFGLVHLSNFSNWHSVAYIGFLYVLSQIFGGLVLGYTRIKLGFWYAVSLHALFNGAAISIRFLFD